MKLLKLTALLALSFGLVRAAAQESSFVIVDASKQFGFGRDMVFEQQYITLLNSENRMALYLWCSDGFARASGRSFTPLKWINRRATKL